MSFGNQMSMVQLPDMTPYYQPVFNRVVGMVQQYAGKNVLRAAQLQLLSANNGANNQMDQVGGWVTDYLLFGLISQTYDINGMQNYIDTAVDFVLKAHCGWMLQNNQSLANSVPREIAQECTNYHNKLMTELNTVYDAKRSTQTNQGGFGQMNQQPQQSYQQNTFQHQQPRQNTHRAGLNVRAENPIGNRHGTENGSVQTGSQARNVSNHRRNKTDTKEVQPQVITATWKPTELQPYPLMINPRIEKLEFGLSNKMVVMKSQALENDKMDRNQHRLSSMTASTITAQGLSQQERREAADNAIRQVSAASSVAKVLTQDKRNETLSNITRHYLPEITSANSLEDLIFTVRFTGAMRHGAESHNTAIRMDGYIHKRFVFVDDESENGAAVVGNAIANAASALTYGAMKNSLQAIHANKNISLKTLANQLDVYFADELNRFVLTNLGVDSLSIDSFFDDLEDLAKAIGNQCGTIYVETLRDNQAKFAAAMLKNFELDTDFAVVVSDATTELVEEESDGKSPVLLTLNQLCSVTTIGLYNKELDIKLYGEGSSVIQSGSHPLLLEFARSVVDDKGRVNEVGFAHHYLVTADNVVYEFQKGSIGTDNFLISRVN